MSAPGVQVGTGRHYGQAMTRKDFRNWGCQEKISTEKWELWGKKEKEVFRGRSDVWEGKE